MTEGGLSTTQAAVAQGVTPPTNTKWLGRYLGALSDASSRPANSPRAIEPAHAPLIVELRQRRMLQTRITKSVGVSASTVSRVLARAGLSKLSHLEPREPAVRYEHETPGEPAHRHQEARPQSAPEPSRHGQPARLRGWRGLGDAVRGRQ